MLLQEFSGEPGKLMIIPGTRGLKESKISLVIVNLLNCDVLAKMRKKMSSFFLKDDQKQYTTKVKRTNWVKPCG